jgi:SAM-dependent methyltransferase
MSYPARLNEGSSRLVHMMLLARSPERILALRLALSSAIGPSSVVLDAGCGSLGVLAIMAARLGARRVVAVDTGPLEVARALAEENGVADRIEFLQSDLAELPAGIGRFDVILGMIYNNEPRRDLEQQRLMAGLATRFAQPGTAFIPGKVRYTVAGYDSADSGQTENTLHDRWDSAVGRAEALTGITMASIREFPALTTPSPANSYRCRPIGRQARRCSPAASCSRRSATPIRRVPPATPRPSRSPSRRPGGSTRRSGVRTSSSATCSSGGPIRSIPSPRPATSGPATPPCWPPTAAGATPSPSPSAATTATRRPGLKALCHALSASWPPVSLNQRRSPERGSASAIAADGSVGLGRRGSRTPASCGG